MERETEREREREREREKRGRKRERDEARKFYIVLYILKVLFHWFFLVCKISKCWAKTINRVIIVGLVCEVWIFTWT